MPNLIATKKRIIALQLIISGFTQVYNERFVKDYGFFRPVVSEVVHDYLKCGDLAHGFARVRCPDCRHEFLLAFSCRGRWFCPSCHTKKVIQFGELLRENIIYPVPHRQYVFSIPIILRKFFLYNRKLLSELCRSAFESLRVFFRTTLDKPDGVIGTVMAIQVSERSEIQFNTSLRGTPGFWRLCQVASPVKRGLN